MLAASPCFVAEDIGEAMLVPHSVRNRRADCAGLSWTSCPVRLAETFFGFSGATTRPAAALLAVVEQSAPSETRDGIPEATLHGPRGT